MNFVFAFGTILVITFLGELLHGLLPLPIPASIYGLLLMLLCLKTGMVKLEKIKAVSDFLLDIMPMLFIPAAVGIIVIWKQLGSIWLPVAVITFVSTVIVMVATGRSTQFFIRKEKGDVNEEYRK